MRDLLPDLNNYVWPANLRYASDTVNDGSASSGISLPYQAVKSTEWVDELHVYTPYISACNGERMVKISSELLKLSPK